MQKDQNKDTEAGTVSRREFVAGTVATTALTGLGSGSASAAEFSADELIYLPASVQLDLFRARQLSPVDVLEAQIKRHEAVNGKVNCTTYTYFDKARKEARESEARWLAGTDRPLEGLTCALKDEHHEKGMHVTQGSVLLKDVVMDKADELTVKLKNAGVVVHMQTTVPEFYFHGTTFTNLWGVTRNPWNLKYSVGGSSGGSGAALSGGMTTIATGSDMAGSVRLPSSFNGTYGFKPPFGRISSEIPMSPFSGTGPMARNFTDMTMMHNVLVGQTPHAPATLPGQQMPLDYPGIAGMKIAYSVNLNYVPVDKDTRDNVNAAADRLRSLGAIVDEIELDMGTTPEEAGHQFLNVALSGPMGGALLPFVDKIDQLTPYAGYIIEKLKGGGFGAAQAAEFEVFMKALYARLADQLWNNGYDALITATVPTPHMPADYDYATDTYEIDGRKLPRLWVGNLTLPWNILNWHPVMCVPAGLSSENMPVGMQIVTRPYSDMTTLRIAHAYEGAMPPLFRGNRLPDFRGG